ncbi:MAG: MotA/TolQ/ExbB proton channel family protein [Parabacteroides sp.]|nr:MotA/TolQ/ExbB proton channel family protein [Parabacteroides sp.]
MEQVSNLLFWISNGLLVPVIVGLLFFFLKSVLLLGGFAGQYLQHAKRDKQLQQRMKALTADRLAPFAAELKELPESLFTGTAGQLLEAPGEAARNRTLSEYEITADAELGKYKLLVKFGPILGLMGTLIPMGPALAGLSSGDISSMAYNMQVAFATTVLGLFAGAVGFVLLQVKQRWFTTDLVYLDYLAALAQEKGKTSPRASSLLTAKMIAE